MFPQELKTYVKSKLLQNDILVFPSSSRSLRVPIIINAFKTLVILFDGLLLVISTGYYRWPN